MTTNLSENPGGHVRRKVTIVGSGNVGASCAMRLAEKGLAEVRKDEKTCKGVVE